MELALLVYGISVLSSAGGFLVAIVAVLCGCLLACCMKLSDCNIDLKYEINPLKKEQYTEYAKTLVTNIKRIVAGICIAGLVGVLLPTEKTMWMMTAAYAGQSMVQSETGKKLGVLIEKKLEGLIEEADSQAKGKIKETVK